MDPGYCELINIFFLAKVSNGGKFSGPEKDV